MSLKSSAVINLGYPIFDVRFVNGGTILTVGGGGEGNNGIPNKITAVKCSFKMKEASRRLQKFREITLPSNEDSPHCMDIERVGEDVADYSVFVGCNQSSQLIKTMNINNYLRKYVYNSDEHLRFIDAVQLEEEVVGDGVDYPKIIRLAPNNQVGCVMTSSFPSVINIFNPDSLDLSFRFQPPGEAQIKDFHLSPKDGKTLCYITSSSIATVSTVTGNMIDSTGDSTDVSKELQKLNLSKVRFVDDTHVVITANSRVKKEAYLLLYSIQEKKITRSQLVSKRFSSIVAVDLCKAKDLIAIAGNDLSVSIIRLSDFHVIKIFRKLHPFAITSVAFSPNGSKLATGSAAHSLHVLKIPTNYAHSKSTLGTIFQYLFTILIVVGLGVLIQTGRENGQLEVALEYTRHYGAIGLSLAQEYGNQGYNYILDVMKGDNLDGVESDEYFSVDHWDANSRTEYSSQSSISHDTQTTTTSSSSEETITPASSVGTSVTHSKSDTTSSSVTPSQSKKAGKKGKSTSTHTHVKQSKAYTYNERRVEVTNLPMKESKIPDVEFVRTVEKSTTKGSVESSQARDESSSVETEPAFSSASDVQTNESSKPADAKDENEVRGDANENVDIPNVDQTYESIEDPIADIEEPVEEQSPEAEDGQTNRETRVETDEYEAENEEDQELGEEDNEEDEGEDEEEDEEEEEAEEEAEEEEEEEEEEYEEEEEAAEEEAAEEEAVEEEDEDEEEEEEEEEEVKDGQEEDVKEQEQEQPEIVEDSEAVVTEGQENSEPVHQDDVVEEQDENVIEDLPQTEAENKDDGDETKGVPDAVHGKEDDLSSSEQDSVHETTASDKDSYEFSMETFTADANTTPGENANEDAKVSSETVDSIEIAEPVTSYESESLTREPIASSETSMTPTEEAAPEETEKSEQDSSTSSDVADDLSPQDSSAEKSVDITSDDAGSSKTVMEDITTSSSYVLSDTSSPVIKSSSKPKRKASSKKRKVKSKNTKPKSSAEPIVHDEL